MTDKTEYYFFINQKCKEILDRINNSIDDIILLNNYSINEETSSELKNMYEELLSDHCCIYKKIKNIQKNVKQHICDLCNHRFEYDSIEIGPENSQNIIYCSICEYTKQ